jgi:integrase
LETKQGRSSNHRRNLRYTRERFAHLDDRKVSDITAADLSPTLDSLGPSSRNLKLSHLKSIFTYAKKRGWTFTNPAEKLDVTQIARAEVEIFTASQVESLFTYALHDDPGLIPYFTFGFFCGIRPDGELLKLDWSCVHFTGDKAEVEIPPGVSKTKRRRFVDLSENALGWLEARRKAGGAAMGPLIAYTAAVLRRKRRRASVATGIRWTRNGMRHTYCSAWLATHKDVNRLVLMSGHDDPDTLWRFYHRGMSEKQAARFWEIIPDTSTSKIVSFHGLA